MREPEIAILPADHPARPAVALALRVALAGAAAFTAFGYLTTQVHAVRASSPWQDDPYYGAGSFTEFLVPALALLIVVRARLYRRAEPQPVFRATQLLRAAFVCTLLLAATIAVDWLAVALRADRALWNDGTPWLVAALVPLTAAAGAALVCEARAFRRMPPRDDRDPGGDWLDDLEVLVDALAARLPAATRLSRGGVIALVRRHIVGVAGMAALVGGLAIGAVQALGEHWSSPVLFLTMVAIGAGGFFAFSLICDTVLQIAVPRGDGRTGGAGRARRAARAAVTAGALALPASAVLRDGIWTAVGRDGQVGDAGQLAVITFAGGLTAAVLAFGATLVITGARRDAGAARSH